MGITSRRLKELKLIDEIVPEPLGGAHRDPDATAKAIGRSIEAALARLDGMTPDELVRTRYARLMSYGVYKSS
jgi:acetyl-CoA carboxylase carboxyl transferase subunit alpha